MFRQYHTNAKNVGNNKRVTNHSLVRDGLDERVEDLGEGMSGDSCSSDTLGISSHAFFPA